MPISQNATNKMNKPWKILLVDDDPGFLHLCVLALEGVSFHTRAITTYSATSSLEAKNIIEHNPDLAVAIIDVVMENNRAGLDLVKHIRRNLLNDLIRIVILTGYPGNSPELEVSMEYNINDYRLKNYFDIDILHGIIINNLRAYDMQKQISDSCTELSSKNEELDLKNQDNSLKISIMAHDLRNAISGIFSCSEILISRPQLNINKMQPLCTGIYNSAAQALHLLDNLLLWVRMDRDNKSSNKYSLVLRELVDDCFIWWEHIAWQKEIKLINNISPDCKVSGQEIEIITILRNLTSNAIKHSPKGEIIKAVSSLENAWVVIKIMNNGINFSPKQFSQLFTSEINSRVGTAGEQGAGLGLKLCKQLIEKWDGKLWVEEQEQGTTVAFSIPPG